MTNRWIANHCQHLMLAFVALRLINYVYRSTGLQILSALILIYLIIRSFSHMNRSTRLIMSALAVISAGLMVYANASPGDWLRAFISNGNIMMLIAVVPLISTPLYFEDYQGELADYMVSKNRGLTSFLTLTSLFTHIMGVVMSVGGMMVSYNLLNPFAKRFQEEEKFLRTLLRAYTSSGFWSPAWATVIVFSTYPVLSWVELLPISYVFSAIFLGLNLIAMEIDKSGPAQPDRLSTGPLRPTDTGRLRRGSLILLTMIGSIVLLSALTGWDLLLIVTLTSLVFPLVVAQVMDRRSELKQQLRHYYDYRLIRISRQTTVFIFAGLFGNALAISGAGDTVIRLIPSWVSRYPFFMVVTILILMIIPSLMGVHPTAIGTAIVVGLTPAALGLTVEAFALAVICGWVVSIMMAPYSAIALMLSAETGRNNYWMTVGLNWRFCLLCIVVYSGLISLVNAYLW